MHKYNIQWDCTLTLTVSTFFSENNIKLYSYYDHHVRNDFHIQIMFGSFSPPVHILFTLLAIVFA